MDVSLGKNGRRGMKALITGSAGYLGHTVVEMMKGDDPVCWDALFYGQRDAHIIDNTLNVESHKGIFENHKRVIYLAELSNDPSCELNPELTKEYNYKAPIQFARVAKGCGVRRFVYASSCSVYGNLEGLRSEDGKIRPLTLYAEHKAKTEGKLLSLSSDDFQVAILRFATLYGHSERMRFDLSINTMCKNMHNEGKITVLGGEQWRPFIHVRDAARALIWALNGGFKGVVNIGANNYRIMDLARLLSNTRKVSINRIDLGTDTRSYNVSFNKMRELGFTAQETITKGAEEILENFKEGKYLQNGEHPKYYNVKWLKMRQLCPKDVI